MVCRFITVVLLCSFASQILGAPIPSETNSTWSSDALFHVVLETSCTTKIVVGNVLQYYCDNMWYFPGVECKDFIEHLTNLTNKTFPELHLREDLNFTSYDDFQMTLVNMTNVISQYNASIQSQLDRELDYLCAPAKELGVPCYYPNACFQGTFRNDATFFCHLRNANSLLKDLKLLLTQMVTTHSFENTTIDNDLLVKSDIPLVWSRWFSMVTLYHLQNLLNQVDNKLRLKF